MKRSIYWDSVKFILIFLVVYTHTVSPFRSDSQFNAAIYNFVYSFHMPLFIFISGRFSHVHNRETYKYRIIKLVETYLVFQTIYAIIALFAGKNLTIANFTKPFWVSWYLLTLAYWRLMVYYIPQKWLQMRKTVLIFSICISIAGGFIPVGYHFAIHRTLSFLPFFVMGYYSTDIDLHKVFNRIPSFIAVATLIAYFVITYITSGYEYAFILHCPYKDWLTIPAFIMTTFPVFRCLFICIVIILSVMILKLVRPSSHLAKWGERTLFIYIYHTLALKLLFQLIFRNYLPQNEWILAVYAILITMGLLYLSRYKVFNMLLNPISDYRESKHRANLNNSEK